MKIKNELDEYLEQLWNMKESGQTAVNVLIQNLTDVYRLELVEKLSFDGLVKVSPDAKDISLTSAGELQARQLIRAHRLAERLIHDVLGSEFEEGACEFEHTVSLELVNSICTMLGHPKECPHGFPIPDGDCCKRSEKSLLNCVVPLNQLKVGTSARIAWIKSRNDQQIHHLEGLSVRPGVTVLLHEKHPACVIECEGAHIALDNEIAANISVWQGNS
jgi:DtxR family Mn-dependent transcriptional regulator